MSLNQETVKIDNSLRNINTLLNKYTKSKLCKYKLTLPQFHTLWLVSKLEPVNMGKLYEKMMVSKSTLTVTVDHLVKKDFVKRNRDKNDRRVVLLKTTSSGKERLQNLLDERQEFFQKSLKKLCLKEQKQLVTLLEIILEDLKLNDDT